MDLGLAGASAVVQGGTQGIGRATAECLAADGARVAVIARTEGDLTETTEHLRALGSPETLALRADVADAEAVAEAFRVVDDRWGSLNILVNAAGPESVGGFEQLSDDDWVTTFDVGLLGVVRCVRAALGLLRRAEWARIVNVSAHSTQRQSPPLVAYTAAKAALTSVSKNLSQALAPDGILVNTVSPGTFSTRAIRGWARSVDVDPDDNRAIMAGIEEHFGHPAQLGRAGDAAEIGAVIAFMASRRNSYMTGADVNVDGGSDFC